MNEIYVVCQLEKKWLLKVFKGRIIQHIKTAQKELYLLNKLVRLFQYIYFQEWRVILAILGIQTQSAQNALIYTNNTQSAQNALIYMNNTTIGWKWS